MKKNILLISFLCIFGIVINQETILQKTNLAKSYIEAELYEDAIVVYKNILNFETNSFIQRDKILLFAQDQLSKDSRKYIELFLNKYSNVARGTCVDIQSGAVILEKSIFQELNFSSFGDYGGELAIYDHLIKHNIPVDTLDMAVEEGGDRQRSNYTIEKILQSVIRSPLSMTRISEILDICVSDYDRYIHSSLRFKDEIVCFLKKYDLIY